MTRYIFSLPKLLPCFILLLVSTSLQAQQKEEDWCRTGAVSLEKDQVRNLVYHGIVKIKSVQDKLKPATYKELKNDYRVLQVQFNSLFRKVSYDIESGGLLVGEGVLCRRYGKSLQQHLTEARDFSDRLNAEYDRVSETPDRDTLPLVFQMLVETFNYIKESVSKAAREKAKVFYEQSRWADFDEVDEKLL